MGADPKVLRDYLLLSGIKADYATALARQLKSRDINAFNESISAAETRLTNEAVENARATARNESIGQILEGAKAKALENDKALKNGIGNQSLDEVVTTFKSQNSGKEFEVSENGFGRELVSYNGKKADDETKRAFMSWEAQGDKADTTLKDGRKVVHLGADEAMELSYGNGYLYGEKNYEALMKRKQSESLEGRFARLQSHPAYENLLKYRENTLANELKGERMLVGDKAAVYYDPQSQRYLRTKPDTAINPERSISLTKTDVKNLRDGKIDQALLTKLESNLDALTADPQASALLDHLLTRDFHLGTAEYKKGLIAQPKKSAWQENFEKIHGIKKDEPNSKIQGGKAGFSTPEIPSAMVGGGVGHMAGSAVGSVAGEYESEGGVAGAIIGALAGLASPKAAAKIAARLMTRNAPKLKSVPLQEYKDMRDGTFKKLLTQQEPVENIESKIIANVNQDGAKKMVSDKAVKKSLKNNFSEAEHFGVAENVRELFKDAVFIGRYNDIKGDPNLKILRFVKNIRIDNKPAAAIITARESTDKGTKRIYSIELDEIRPVGVRASSYAQATENLMPSSPALPPHEAARQNLSGNYTPEELLSQGQVPAGWMKGATNIGSSAKEQPKWGEKLKAKMAKMGQEYSDEKIANLANWHKNSHAITKERDGSPKVFYHGTDTDEFKYFDKDNSGNGYFFSTLKSEAEHYKKGYEYDDTGGTIYNTFLNIKKPFEMDKVKINNLKDLQDFAKFLGSKQKLDENDFKKYKALANWVDVIRQKAADYGFKVTELSINDITLTKGKKSIRTSIFSNNYRSEDPNERMAYWMFRDLEPFDSIEDGIDFSNYIRNDADIATFLLDDIRAEYGSAGYKSLKEVLKKKGYDGIKFNEYQFSVFSPNQIKSIDNSGAFNPRSKMMRGFSTQALNEVMLGLGSGTANAMAEDDPNKKAEAFIKGFLAGFGGAKAAGMLAKNAPKLSPQLARVSQKMAQDFPNLMNNRPDILGGVLGHMNNAKDNFKNIFGGEKALGANKAKLEEAQTMLESGKNEGEIWAKTGWYKDIDGKWKFEINPKGGESKIFSDEISTIEGELGTIADQRLAQIEGKNLGEILKDDELFKAYPMLKDIKISAEKNYAGSFKGYEITLNLSLKGNELKKTLYHEIQHAVQVIEGFAKGTSPKNMNLQTLKEWGELKEKALNEARELNKNEIAKMSEAERIIFDDTLQDFARNKANEQMYLKSAGEAESRNVETRLGSSAKEREYIVNNPQRKELIAQIKEVTAKNSNLDQIMSDYKAGKITAEQRNELIKQNSENIQKATAQLVAKREMLDKKLAEEYLAKTHPYETMDVAPNERIVSYDGGVSASVELEKDLLTSQGRVNTNALLKNASELPKPLSRDEFSAQFVKNSKGDSYIKTPIGDIKVNVNGAWEHFTKNTYFADRLDSSGAFLQTIQDPLFVVKQRRVVKVSQNTIGQSPAYRQNAKHGMGSDNKQESITNSIVFFKPFKDENGGVNFAAYAINKDGKIIQTTFHDVDFGSIKQMIKEPENNVLYYKNAKNQQTSVKSGDLVNSKSSLNAQSKELLKQKIKASDGDFSGANDARARLVLDKHRTKAEQIRKEKGVNSPEYQKAKNFADEFEATHFESDGTPKLVPSPCRL